MFLPKLITCLKQGYSIRTFYSDLFAGVTVGLVAIPLAMAFAIASGVSPDRGIYTAVIAGFIISTLGGSRVQIGGPTGAFVVIVYSIVQKYGYEGLVTATFIAGFILILLGVFKFGNFIKFIPYPVITGFTSGIAIIILTSQIKDFFGLQTENLPADFIHKIITLAKSSHTMNLYALAIAATSTGIIFLFRKYFPRLPAAVLVIAGGSLISYLLHFPVETIGSKYGAIPDSLPRPMIPMISFSEIPKIVSPAITIALLGAIESLLSATVADSMTGYRHRSNMELVAQGTANIFSVIFGGIPATGAIARTATNIKSGGKTPVAGIIHALTLLLFIIFLAPLAKYIPLASLSAVLVVVAWYMSEAHNFIYTFRASRSDMYVLVITFLLTVLVDLTVAVEVGLILSAMMFIKKMSDVSGIEKVPDSEAIKDSIEKKAGGKIQIYEINGPLFFGVVSKLMEVFRNIGPEAKVLILRMAKVSSIDVSGMQALEYLYAKCKSAKIDLILSEVSQDTVNSLYRVGFNKKIGDHHTYQKFDDAIAEARRIIK